MKSNQFKLIAFIFILFCSCISNAEVIIPDKDTHQAFLLGEWDAKKPILVTLKDPRCGFCIRALQKRERLENYNVFMFWAPILGEASRLDVERYFHCKSPVSPQVLDAVIQRKTLHCNGNKKSKLAKLNSQMVRSYKPNSVPQYWYAGVRVNPSQLNLSLSNDQKIKAIIDGSLLKVSWDRYQSNAVNSNQQALNIGLVVPTNLKISQELMAELSQDKRLNWYVFENSSKETKGNLEFRILTGLLHPSKMTFVLEGKVLSEKEINLVLSKRLIAILSAS